MGKCGFKVVCLYPEIEESCTKRLKKYHTYTVIEEHYGGIDNKGQYYINNFWFSKLCFVPLHQLRKDKIEHLKTKICLSIK